MNEETRSQVRQVLQLRRSAIAQRWHAALARVCSAPLPTQDLSRHLDGLAGRLIEVFLSDPSVSDEAEALGAAIAGLCCPTPEVLACTQEILAAELTRDLSNELAVVLQPQLSSLLVGLASGFVQSLAAANEELRREVEESGQVEEALQQSEETVRSLLNAMTGDVVSLVDGDGTIIEINESTARRFGKSADELVGTHAWALLPPEVAQLRKARVDEVFQTGKPVRFEDYRAGTWFDNINYPVCNSHGEVVRVAILARDITERKCAEEELRASLERASRNQRILLALSAAAQAVQRARTADEVYRTIGDGISGLGYNALVFALTADGSYLRAVHVTYDTERRRAGEELTGVPVEDYCFPLLPEGLYQRVLLAQGASVSDCASDLIAEALPASTRPLAEELAAAIGAEQVVCTPLVVDDRPFGLLAVTGTGLGEDETQAMAAFANQAAIALANVRLYQEARDWASDLELRVAERTRALSAARVELEAEVAERSRVEAALRRSQRLLLALGQAAQAVQQARSPLDVFQTIASELEDLGYHAIVFSLSDDRTYLRISFVTLGVAMQQAAEKLSGLSARNVRVPLVPDGLFQPVLEGQSVFFERTIDLVRQSFPHLGNPLTERLVTLLGMAKSIYSPLRASEQVWGMLAVAGADLTREDTPAVTAFANQAGIALENARLLEELSAGRERLRQLAHQVVSTQEEERQRLSRVLHDEAGQALTALKISLQLLGQDLPPGLPALKERLDDAIGLADITMDRVRGLAQDLRPPALDAVGLNHTLEGLCREVARHAQLSIDYSGVDLPCLVPEASICLYRFLQEALTNVIKHASASCVGVALRYDAETVSLAVEDDGQGFDVGSRWHLSGEPMGLGLLGMEERLEALQGRLEIESQPAQGTRLVAHIPLEEAEGDQEANHSSAPR